MKEIRFLAAGVGVLAVIAVGFVLREAQAVFMPLVIAWLLSYVLAPVVRFLTNLKIPLGLTIAVVVLSLFSLVFLSVTMLSSHTGFFIQVLPSYYDRFMVIARDLSSHFALPPSFWQTFDWSGQLRTSLIQLSGSLVNITSKTLMVFIFLVFILVGTPYMEFKIRKAFVDEESHRRVVDILASISRQIGRFLGVMSLISAVTGFCVWLALSTIGVDFALTWGILAFALNFIPTVGSIVASLPPILVAVVQFYPGLLMPAITAGVLMLIQNVIGNLITPKVMGDNLNLSPVVILLSLLFWGWLWGVVGALLAVPLAAIIKIVCDNFPSLHTLGVLMGSGKSYSKEFD